MVVQRTQERCHHNSWGRCRLGDMDLACVFWDAWILQWHQFSPASPLFAKLANGESPLVEFEANGRTYNMGYYLADGIYPKWATFAKPISSPQGNKELYFHNAQAAAKKDVERAFEFLQAQFSIVRGPTRFWYQDILWYIITAGLIMHNMIIENECVANIWITPSMSSWDNRCRHVEWEERSRHFLEV